MEGNKLYDALLKTQEVEKSRREQQRRAPAEEAPQPQAEQQPAGDGRVRTRTGATYEDPTPNWTMVEAPGQSPSLYDPALTLDRIGNPEPWSNEQMRERKIIFPAMEDKNILDAYRQIRIALRNKAGKESFAVMISSLAKKDESSLTAFNLAATFALDPHTSALLVDCNPYNSDLNRFVSTPMDFGVTDFVADKSVKVSDILYPSGIDRLSVIPAGNQAASAVELFTSVRMKTLMEELQGRYPDRCIIINAPPMRKSTEARILVRYAHQVVLSVPFGEVTKEDVEHGVEALGTDKFSGIIYQE